MKYVYTYGVFDMLHVGHIRLLKETALLGDSLIVGLFTDKVAKQFKRQPIIPFDQRLEILQSIAVVQEVVIQDVLSPIKTLKKLRKEKHISFGFSSLIIAKGPGANYEKDYIQIGNEANIPAVLLAYHEGASTTDIIKKCQQINGNNIKSPSQS